MVCVCEAAGRSLETNLRQDNEILTRQFDRSMPPPTLPLFLQGEVVKGFGRGSKQLGCPTANFSFDVVRSLPKGLEPGVYYGWAQVDTGPVHKMVANVGWCPFYQNKELSVETHVMHKFDSDFYGSKLKIAMVGYLRGEMNFSSLAELIAAIKKDISDADAKLDEMEAEQPSRKSDPVIDVIEQFAAKMQNNARKVHQLLYKN